MASHCTSVNGIHLPSHIEFESPLCPRGSCDECLGLAQLKSSLQVAISNANELLLQFQRKKTSVNRAHSAINRMLPTEIISVIFRHHVASENRAEIWDNVDKTTEEIRQRRTFSITMRLGMVCSLWRQTTSSCPHLWTYVRISLQMSKDPEGVEFIKEWISRSGTLPLNLALYHPEHSPQKPSDYSSLLRVIGQSFSRWGVIELRLPFNFIRHLGEMVTGHAHFKKLNIVHKTHDDVTGISSEYHLWEHITPAPTCEHLKLLSTTIPPRWLNIGWSLLTEATFRKLSGNQCLEILQAAPLLQRCHFSEVDDAGDIFRMSRSIITHHNLKHLVYISFRTHIAQINILDFLRLTHLLRLEYKPPLRPSDDSLLSFFKRSSPPLSHLRLYEGAYSSEFFESIARLIPSLEYLFMSSALHERRRYDIFPPEKFIQLLKDTTEASEEDHDQPLLPRLKSLQYHTACPFPWHLVPGIVSMPSQLESNPRRRPLKTLKVGTMKTNLETEKALIPKDVLPQLLALRRGGAVITYMDHPVDLFAHSMAQHGVEEGGEGA